MQLLWHLLFESSTVARAAEVCTISLFSFRPIRNSFVTACVVRGRLFVFQVFGVFPPRIFLPGASITALEENATISNAIALVFVSSSVREGNVSNNFGYSNVGEVGEDWRGERGTA